MPGRLVIADASPLHYLVLIGCSDILPALFETVFIPTVVRDELLHPEDSRNRTNLDGKFPQLA